MRNGSASCAAGIGCRQSYHSTRWRWRCGPEHGLGSWSRAWSITATRVASQYTSIRFATRLPDAGALASIGTVGDSFDNALAESRIGLYKTECVRHDGPWRAVEWPRTGLPELGALVQ